MIKRIAVALAVAISVLGAAACGGDDDDGDGRSNGDSSNGGGQEFTLVDYFAELQDLNDAAEEKTDELAPDLDPEAEIDDARTAFVEFLEEVRDVFKDFVNGLEDVDPPDEADTLHADGIETMNELVAAFDDLIDEVGEVDSVQEILTLDTPDVDEATDRFSEICADLQQLAIDNEIEVTLNCE